MSKTPKLRFPEFSGEWQHKKLYEIVERVIRKNKGVISKMPLTISAQYGLIDQEKFFNKTVASSNLEGYYLLYNGDFAYNKSYSNGYPFGTIKRLDKYDMGVVSSLYICFKPLDTINSEYIVQYFETNKWHKEVSMIAVEGARNHGLLNIAVSDFFETLHYMPCNSEQQKIASFLSLVDKKIEKQSEKVEAIKEYKKGMMQKIFSREIRFKDDEGKEFPEWEEKKLKALIYNKKKGNQPAYSDCGNILLSNEYLENKFSTVYVKNPIDVEYDDVLILWDGSQAGKCYTGVKGVLGSTFVSLTLKKDISPVYIYQYLSFKIDIIKLAWREGSGVPHVSKDFINNFKINICCIKEQKKIANFLSTIDKKLKKEEEKLEALRAWKKGLLQQMFV